MWYYKKNIEQNIKIHNSIYRVYNLKHPEIYNDFEQERIEKIIGKIKQQTYLKNLRVLDVGAGTGNLSLKFLKEGCKVVATDVSKNSLDLLMKLSNHNNNLELSLIEDKNLRFENNSFDIVATYSVLHHIPDYLFAIEEMVRVTKVGGFIYIDHEANEEKWRSGEKLKEYYKLAKQTKTEHLIKLFKTRELFTLGFIKTILIRLFNSRYRREGDIHVWLDDHIEWDKIKKHLNVNCKIIEENDYLLYRPKVSLKLYNQYKEICTDTKYLIFQKIAN